MTRRVSKDRRLGWRPPTQIQVSIAEENYQYIKQIAVARNQRSAPFYDTLQSVIREFEQLKELREDLEIVRQLLAVGMKEKGQLEKENKEMRNELQKYNQLRR